MPSTVNVNYLTVVHKKSGGVAICFPDVCKTPTPGGPVPIPYPNIAMSSQAAKTTKKVKIDGEGVMVKGSNFSMSSGDEAGNAGGGVVSNRFKGKAEFMNYSFDVKFEGKAVSRLADPMGNNLGSAPNGLTPSELQGPIVVIQMDKIGEDQAEACEKVEECKQKEPDPDRLREKGKKAGYSDAEIDEILRDPDKAKALDAGMVPEHYDAIRDVVSENNAIVSFRDTNPSCIPHLSNDDVASKGHDVLTKTFEAEALTDADKGLAGLVSTNPSKPTSVQENARDLLHSTPDGQLLTGDYDMGDVITASNGNRVRGGSTKENRLIERMNDAIPGSQDRIKHGAQANYSDFLRKEAGEGKSVVDAATDRVMHEGAPGADSEKFVKSLNKPGIDEVKGEGLTVFDGSKTPADVYRLETNEDVVNFYRCKGTNMPEEWNIRANSETGKRVRSKV